MRGFPGVDRVGPRDVEPLPLEPGDVLSYVGDNQWIVRRPGEKKAVAQLQWSDIRFSVSWKAYCFADEAERDAWRSHDDDLTMSFILETLRRDLDERGITVDPAISDRDLALLLIDTYEDYPAPQPLG